MQKIIMLGEYVNIRFCNSSKIYLNFKFENFIARKKYTMYISFAIIYK